MNPDNFTMWDIMGLSEAAQAQTELSHYAIVRVDVNKDMAYFKEISVKDLELIAAIDSFVNSPDGLGPMMALAATIADRVDHDKSFVSNVQFRKHWLDDLKWWIAWALGRGDVTKKLEQKHDNTP